MTAEKVRNSWLGMGGEGRLLMQAFDGYLRELEKRVGKGRSIHPLGVYRDARRHLADLLEYEYHLTDIPFNELKREFIGKNGPII